MKTAISLVPISTIEAFADQYGLQMNVRERRGQPIGSEARFFASFERSEVQRGRFLAGSYGDGKTPAEAIANYAKEISEQTLVVDAYTPQRREILVPRLA